MGRWARSKQLVAASWSVVAHDKELMVLPLLSGLAGLALASTFLVPIWTTSMGTDAMTGETTFSPGAPQWIALFVMYIVLAYASLFFKTALICGADERMRGGNPTVSSALASATAHAGRILPWAIVTATVSFILRAAEERAGFLGRILIGLVGVAWAVVTFLVLPVLVFEQVSVGKAVSRSAEMLKHTWGENLIVNTGIGLVTFVAMLPAFIGIAAGAATGTALGFGTMVVLGILWVIGVACWSSAMSAVFQLALYRYATEGVAPGAFRAVDFGSAFTTRASRRRTSFGF